MRSKQLTDGPERTFALVFDPGDEAMAELLAFARDHHLSAAHFHGIGAFSDATLAFFDLERREYDPIPVEEQVEVLALVGNVTLAPDGDRKVHAHVVVGKPDGTAHGGHLLAAHVRPTLEIFLTETAGVLRRRDDESTGLALVDLEGSD
jgi:predicted DNA-binding protein with PD1-like motif